MLTDHTLFKRYKLFHESHVENISVYTGVGTCRRDKCSIDKLATNWFYTCKTFLVVCFLYSFYVSVFPFPVFHVSGFFANLIHQLCLGFCLALKSIMVLAAFVLK